MNDKVKARALKTFDNLEDLIKRDRMDHVGYIDGTVDEKLAAEGAVCRGHKACFVGSTYLAYGIKPVVSGDRWYRSFTLEGIHDQKGYVARRPALKVVWEACNRAAARRLARIDTEPEDGDFTAKQAAAASAGAELRDIAAYDGHAEVLFEDFYQGLPREELRKRMLSLVRSARREVEAA